MSIKRLKNLSALGIDTLKRIPTPQITKVNLALTTRCNHRCLSCNIWKSNGKSKDEFTLSEVSYLLRHNPQLMWVSLTGGEPSLDSEFPEILSKCLESVRLVNVITNGERPDIIVPSVQLALQNSPDNHILIVHVTLFGESYVHDKMTGVKQSYDHAVETMQGLKNLGNEHRLILGFEHMIGNENPLEYKFVKYKANQMKVGITYTLEQDADYYSKSGVKQNYKIPRISMTLNPIDQFKNAFILNGKRKMGCVAGEYSVWITHNKLVYPCFFSIPDNPSYNILNTDWELTPEKFKKDMKWIKKCGGCSTPCESYPMLALRPWRILAK